MSDSIDSTNNIDDIDDTKEPLEAFASSLIQSDQVWGLQGEDGWAICDSIEFEETEVLLFFASEESAAQLCVDEWQSYQPKSFSLEEFLQDWLPGMHEDHVMVGIQWNSELEGPELEPADVAAAFSEIS